MHYCIDNVIKFYYWEILSLCNVLQLQ